MIIRKYIQKKKHFPFKGNKDLKHALRSFKVIHAKINRSGKGKAHIAQFAIEYEPINYL